MTNNTIQKLIIKNPQWISRSGLSWIFVTQVFVMAPHFLYVPLWVAAVWFICALWRWQVFQGVWSFPNAWLKTLFVGAASFALLLTTGPNFSFQTMTSLLIIGFSLKLLEMKSARDYLWIVFMALFIVAAQFIEFSDISSAFYAGLCLSFLCVALMQLEPNKNTVWQQWKKSSVILLQAIPLMLIFFVAFPRLASFWSVPSPQAAKTGMSDSMSPGDFSNLMQSNELVFRVKFDGQIPANKDLYWRGLVFSNFDGRSWSAENSSVANNRKNNYVSPSGSVNYLGRGIQYDVIVEPTNTTWLYALAAPQSWSPDVFYSRDMRLSAYTPLTQMLRYKVTSQLDYEFSASQKELQMNLRLPEGVNPKAREFVKNLGEQTSSTQELIQKIFAFYHREFYYTLQPPVLGKDVVDEFLFNTHRGFCEHYASSFVFLLRAAGVPARVVVGYQGGEVNPVDGVLSVRQRDAHAWAEVWIDETESVLNTDPRFKTNTKMKKGWVMFDPTAAVAPERIERGIESALNEQDQAYLAHSFGASVKVLAWMRSQIEAMNYQWTHWVLNYDSDLQMQVLSRWIKNVSPLSIVLWMLGLISLLLGALLGWLILRSKPKDLNELEKFYRSLCSSLKPLGFVPEDGEPPASFFVRIGSRHEVLKEPAKELAETFNRFAFGDERHLKAAVQTSFIQLKQRIITLKSKI